MVARMIRRRFRGATMALRGGAWVSGLLLAIGLADALIAPDPAGAIGPEAFAAAVRGLLRFETGSFLHLGLLALLLTPVARLVVLTFELARRRETTFVLVALGVLFLLGSSVWIGLH
ncbi:MAG: DUF1634 domain-containing protein [Thermoanaerobaculia bacterium]